MSLETKLPGFMNGIDPRFRMECHLDYRHDTKVLTIRWNTLGFSMKVKAQVSRAALVKAHYDPTYDIARALMDEVVTAIIEGYIEYWHLYYDGSMSLKDFMGWNAIEAAQYIDSDGNYKGAHNYARVSRLQQRDSGRFATPKRIIGEDV